MLLSNDPSLVLSTFMRQLTTICNFSFLAYDTSSWLSWTPSLIWTYIQIPIYSHVFFLKKQVKINKKEVWASVAFFSLTHQLSSLVTKILKVQAGSVACFTVCLQIIDCLTGNWRLGVSNQGKLKLLCSKSMPISKWIQTENKAYLKWLYKSMGEVRVIKRQLSVLLVFL